MFWLLEIPGDSIPCPSCRQPTDEQNGLVGPLSNAGCGLRPANHLQNHAEERRKGLYHIICMQSHSSNPSGVAFRSNNGEDNELVGRT